jgi:hypothetical protein
MRHGQSLYHRMTARVLAGLLLMSSLGCGTVRHGSQQEVIFVTFPPGATATIDGDRMIETSGTMQLSRRHHYEVEVTKEGYKPQTITIQRNTSPAFWGNTPWLLLFIVPGVVGFLTDLLTAGAYELAPDEVILRLERVDGGG